MHEPLLSLAALPAPVHLYGLQLKPYSLGHELFLIRENSPCIYPEGKPTRAQMMTAVLICSQSWEESCRIEQDYLLRFKLWFWERKNRGTLLNQSLGSFREYRLAGSREFPVSDSPRPEKISQSAPRPPGTPFILRLQQFLITTLQLSESQAWDYPVGLAKMRWAAHWEMEGGLDVYNEHDAEFDRFVREQEAKGKEQLCRA